MISGEVAFTAMPPTLEHSLEVSQRRVDVWQQLGRPRPATTLVKGEQRPILDQPIIGARPEAQIGSLCVEPQHHAEAVVVGP